MKIVIADGFHEADYIINMYKSGKHQLTVINSDENICKYLCEKNNIAVMHGNPTKIADLRQADISEADLFIALSNNDINNYVACKCAKQLFGINRCIATVINPKNVDLFKKLGIDSVLCSTYLLAERIRNQTSVENLISTLTLENEKIVILEFLINENMSICGKALSEINISSFASVSSVYRLSSVIIPNGSTKLLKGDKVLVVTTEENKNRVVNIFRGK